MTGDHADETERDGSIECPDCEETAASVEQRTRDDPAVDFIVANGGEIAFAKTVSLIEYTFHPCEHTFLGTEDRGEGRSLHTGTKHEETDE